MGITVFDQGVKYPKIALSPDILTDDLAEEFVRIFKKGERRIFPYNLLYEYGDILTECTNCKTWFPSFRVGCPICAARTIIVFQRKPSVLDKGVQGNIVYSKLIDNTMFLIVNENGETVLYRVKEEYTERMELFKEIPGCRFALTLSCLIVNPAYSEDLYLLDITGKSPQAIGKTKTDMFTVNRHAMFRATSSKLIRIVRGTLLQSDPHKPYEDTYIRDVLEDQTWFSVNENSSELEIFGFISILSDQKYWYTRGGQNFEPPMMPLNLGESLLDINVKFSSRGALVRRLTQLKGEDYLISELVNMRGEVEYTSRIKISEPVTLHGHAYSSGVLLSATDDGIVQEKLSEELTTTFSATEPYVHAGNSLYVYKKGLLVVSMDSVTYLTLG
jgi:hypothetical protein